MDATKLARVVGELAKARGYRRRGLRLWKSGPELTLLIQLQRSQWSRGVYVNYGVTPTAMLIANAPPPLGNWGRTKRAETTPSPFHDAFCQLVQDHDDQMDPAEMIEPFNWLLAHIDAEYGDTEAFRKAELARYGNTWGILPDWANGVLNPSDYLPTTPRRPKEP